MKRVKYILCSVVYSVEDGSTSVELVIDWYKLTGHSSSAWCGTETITLSATNNVSFQ